MTEENGKLQLWHLNHEAHGGNPVGAPPRRESGEHHEEMQKTVPGQEEKHL